jgi:multiple sugar transport system substrate-binding protein
MRLKTTRKYLSLLLVAVTMLLLLTQCAAPTTAPAAEAPAEQAAAPAGDQAAAPAAEFNSAERAIEEAKKYAGTTINVVWESGLQPQDPLTFAPEFEEATGITVNVVEVPYVDMYTKQLQDHLSGGGSYDVITYAPSWLIDFVNAGVVEPLNPYIDKYMNKADLEGYLDVYGAEGYGRLGDTWYGLPDDGDVFVMYYRKDLFEDPAHQEAFKQEYGRDLAVPQTYAEFTDACKYFTEKLGPDVYGCAFQHLEGQAFDWFIGPYSGAGGQWFDPETMEPGINSDTGVKVLTDMVNITQYMPPGVQKWGFTEVLSAWLDGKVAMIISWPPIGRWSNGIGKGTEQLSWVPETKVVDKVGYALEPGGRSALAGGFALGVSPDSQNKDAAYLFAQWMNSPETSMKRVMLPYALRDPFRKEHYASPEYRALWSNAGDYLDTLEAGAMKGQYELGVPGAREYMDALDKAITAAYAGTDPKAALDEAAVKWNEITDRLGRDAQKEAYATWLQGEWNKPGPR